MKWYIDDFEKGKLVVNKVLESIIFVKLNFLEIVLDILVINIERKRRKKMKVEVELRK